MNGPSLASGDSAPATECRACTAASLVPLFSLGDMYLCNAFPREGETPPRGPLDLLLCDPGAGGCGLVQLRHSTAAALMYSQYWYKSGLSSTMRDHLQSLVMQAERLVDLRPGDTVLDIGANDGTTLRAFRTANVRTIGFEPSQLAGEARVGTSAIIPEFFCAESFRAEVGGAQARIVTTIAMFYDLDDPGGFIDDVRACLAPDGVWIIEMHYLASIVKTNGFDAIVHEHVTYYSLTTLERMLKRHGMETFDVELNDMNGGSFRIFVRHAGAERPRSSGGAARLRERRRVERAMRLDNRHTYHQFWNRIQRVKQRARAFAIDAAARGERLYVYGASTKGNAVLQFFGFDRGTIVAAADLNRDKWGRVTPGTRIPIISPEQAARNNPDYFLVLIWHLLDEVAAQWATYLAAGGRLLVPLPRFRLARGTVPAASERRARATRAARAVAV
jgi:hypothetical protein